MRKTDPGIHRRTKITLSHTAADECYSLLLLCCEPSATAFSAVAVNNECLERERPSVAVLLHLSLLLLSTGYTLTEKQGLQCNVTTMTESTSGKIKSSTTLWMDGAFLHLFFNPTTLYTGCTNTKPLLLLALSRAAGATLDFGSDLGSSPLLLVQGAQH